MLAPFRMVCRNFILTESANRVFLFSQFAQLILPYQIHRSRAIMGAKRCKRGEPQYTDPYFDAVRCARCGSFSQQSLLSRHESFAQSHLISQLPTNSGAAAKLCLFVLPALLPDLLRLLAPTCSLFHRMFCSSQNCKSENRLFQLGVLITHSNLSIVVRPKNALSKKVFLLTA